MPILQRDYYAVVDARVGKAVSWTDIPLEDEPPERDARFSGTAVNESFLSTKYVRVGIVLTHLGQMPAATEILDRIEIYTYADIEPPYVPFSTCLIQANTVLNNKDQLDYVVCLVYPHDAPTGQYLLNIKIYGNYE